MEINSPSQESGNATGNRTASAKRPRQNARFTLDAIPGIDELLKHHQSLGKLQESCLRRRDCRRDHRHIMSRSPSPLISAAWPVKLPERLPTNDTSDKQQSEARTKIEGVALRRDLQLIGLCLRSTNSCTPQTRHHCESRVSAEIHHGASRSTNNSKTGDVRTSKAPTRHQKRNRLEVTGPARPSIPTQSFT